MANAQEEQLDLHPWRFSAPRARRLTIALYSWESPGYGFVFSLVVALAFIVFCAGSPALLSLNPTLEMLAPVAQARALAAGSLSLTAIDAPFMAFLMMIADIFVDTPGRIHLVAKALAAAAIALPFAFFMAVRFPTSHTILFSAALAAFICAPFAGTAEIALSYYVAFAVAMLCAPADETRIRAALEGTASAVILFALWMTNPVFSLLGLLALAACPFVSGRRGIDRYFATILVFAGIIALSEVIFRGLNIERADAVTEAFALSSVFNKPATGLVGVGVSTLIVVFAAFVFGGREHWRSWAVSSVFILASFIAAIIVGANAMPLFVIGAAIACLSVASPFYDGIFRAHDRASIAISASVAALTLFWTAAMVVHAGNQMVMQIRVAGSAPNEIRAELGLVQPGGPAIARWIEEGRFSTPEARELLALAPVDHSMMLLDAAARAKSIGGDTAELAILTEADTGCVIADMHRQCAATGSAAASKANIVFVPRIDFSATTGAVKASAEAMLYTDFKMIEQTPFWDVWVRREATITSSPIGLE